MDTEAEGHDMQIHFPRKGEKVNRRRTVYTDLS
jgi:hypothetical protein